MHEQEIQQAKEGGRGSASKGGQEREGRRARRCIERPTSAGAGQGRGRVRLPHAKHTATTHISAVNVTEGLLAMSTSLYSACDAHVRIGGAAR